MDNEQRKVAEYLAKEIADWLETKKGEIPNVEKLIVRLRTNKGHEGHTVHAQIIKKIYESNKFKITDVENDDGNYDIDVQLDDSINIQIHYGASVSWYNSQQGKVSELGGVETDWDKDEKVIFSKTNQLPNSGIGIMFQFAYGMGSTILPEWRDKLPDNKVVVLAHLEINGKELCGVADIHCSGKFKEIDLVTKVVNAAGFSVRGVFQ